MKLFDLHADVLMDLVRRGSPVPELGPRHLERMREGGIAGAVLVDCRMAGESADHADLERFIARVRLEFPEPADSAAVAGSVSGLRSARIVRDGGELRRAIDEGIFAAIIAYEGLSAARGDISWIRRLYDEAGLRVAALTHNDDNELGGGALGARDGLTPAGREALALMNRLGILVDLAHAGKATRRDILESSTRPVMLSHTSARSVYDNGRNLSDAEMRAIADRGGLVGCMTSPAALAAASDRGNQNLERYLAHLRRMIGAAGIDHVGLGMHFCEYLYSADVYPPPQGLEDASRAQGIIEGLRAAGFAEDEIEKVAWRNFARIFAEACGA